jgi:predicted secreted protein
MLRLALLASAALVAGCTSILGQQTDWPELRANPREFFNLNPPVRLAAGEIRGPVVLKRGQALIVRLPEDAANGPVWRLRPFTSSVLIAPVQHDYTKSVGEAGGGEATFRMRGVGVGTQAVVIDAIRPGFVQPEKSVAFDVVLM